MFGAIGSAKDLEVELVSGSCRWSSRSAAACVVCAISDAKCSRLGHGNHHGIYAQHPASHVAHAAAGSSAARAPGGASTIPARSASFAPDGSRSTTPSAFFPTPAWTPRCPTLRCPTPRKSTQKRRKDAAFTAAARFIAGEAVRALLDSCQVIGLLTTPATTYASRTRERRLRVRGLEQAAIEQRIEQRNAARAAKDFAKSDELRNELLALGVEIADTPQGTLWRIGM